MLYVTQIVFLIYMTSTEWGHKGLGNFEGPSNNSRNAPRSHFSHFRLWIPRRTGTIRIIPSTATVAYTSCVAGIHPYYWVPSGKLTNCAAKNHNVNGQNQRTKWATFKSYFDITRGYLKMGIDPPLWRFSWGN